MTPEQVAVVRTSYASLGDATTMAGDFYARLFALDPSAELLFTDGPDVMAGKFAAELAALVEAISEFGEFAARARELGTRHAAYGVQTTHYHSACEALVGSLAEHLGERWNSTVEAAWRRAYNLVAELMMSAAATTQRQR
jgi:hemoglobin-like flavoprotein